MNPSNPKYPHLRLEVNTRGAEENAYILMARARNLMRTEGRVPNEELAIYTAMATSGDYNNVIKVTADYLQLVDRAGEYDTNGDPVGKGRGPIHLQDDLTEDEEDSWDVYDDYDYEYDELQDAFDLDDEEAYDTLLNN